MAVEYREEDDTYYERYKVENQTIELGINFYDQNEHDRKGWFNIYISIFNKRKDMYSNMDKKILTGKNPFATVIAARKMFKDVEATVVQEELTYGAFDEITIFCTWVDNRRRDAYYKILSRMGYTWGRVDGHKCIMKTFKKEKV